MRVSTRWTLQVLLAALAGNTLIACDTVAPPRSDTEIIVADPSGVTALTPFEAAEADLTETFKSSSSGGMSFDVVSVTGPLRATVQTGHTLVVEPTGVGNGTVTVLASAPDRSGATATFSFEIADPGPLPAAQPAPISLGEVREVDLYTVIRASPAYPPAIRIDRVEGPGAVSIRGGRYLVVTPSDAGRLTVALTASRFVDQSVTLTFDVVDPCPAAVPTGQVDVFPIAVGSRWSYALSTARNATSETADYRSSGRIEVEVVAAGTCTDGAQAFTVRERRTETTERYGYRNVWEPYLGPTTTERTYVWTVTHTEVTTTAPDLSGRPGAGLGPPPFARQAPRFVASSQLFNGQYVVSGGPFGPFVTFTPGVGPTRYSTATLFGTAGTASETWAPIE